MYDEQLKRDIINSTNNVRKKYQMLKEGLLETNQILERNFKPIIDPLNKMVENQNIISSHIKTEIKDENRKYDDIFKKEKIENEQVRDIKINKNETSDEVSSESNDEFEPSNDHFDDVLSDNDSDDSDEVFSSNKYTSMLINQKPGLDSTYGVRYFNGEFLLGNSNVHFDKKNNVIVNNETYSNTHGLYELLFKKIPDKKIYTSHDLLVYEKIGLETNLFRRKYDSGDSINGNQSKKYTGIISKLIKSEKKNFKTGSALKLYNNRNIFKNYVQKGKKIKNSSDMLIRLESAKSNPSITYWNDINELVERLRLIISSAYAGNNSHDNEIISILEELREEHVIY